ncbi:hypothetical protein LEP1GSC073_1957 [Leptospira noguchii str. Cascata]|nr:hypothetical protein LEP1GSC073_1957 [Leptospira noguchii str. Cascata]
MNFELRVIAKQQFDVEIKKNNIKSNLWQMLRRSYLSFYLENMEQKYSGDLL